MTGFAGTRAVTAGARAVAPREYVMCPPTYFAVPYSINPWMDPGTPVDPELAMTQWSALKCHYERLGHTVRLVEPVPELPDMVFAANSATVLGRRALGARFRTEQRAPEAEYFRRWFATQGYQDLVAPVAINEAEGDFVWTGNALLAGSGFRTDPRSHAEAQEALGVPVVSLELIDPRYYHLDTALFVLSEGERPRIAYYPAAFSARARDVLRRMFPDAVIAEENDAACLGLNGISDGRHVVLPVEATGLARRLAKQGYEPLLLDISELRKSGGGPKCCTLELHGDPGGSADGDTGRSG